MSADRVHRVHPLLLIALAVALLWLVANNVRPPSYSIPRPSSSPTTPPHFEIDDLDLGPTVRLTRFVPDFDMISGLAVEGADEQLYIAYSPDRPPSQWHQMGGYPSRLGILREGRITPIAISNDKPLPAISPTNVFVDFQGILNGMPAYIVRDDRQKTIRMLVGSHEVHALPPTKELADAPLCAPFDGGSICNEHVPALHTSVRITTREGRSILIGGGQYTYDVNSYAQSKEQIQHVTEAPDVWLAGGGRHRFLLVEEHAGPETAECIEGFAP